MASKKQTSDQQRGSEAPVLADTAAQAHYAAETFGPATRKSSADKRSTSTASRQRHDLLGVGSHSFNEGSNQYDTRTPYNERSHTCPYHGPIVYDRLTSSCFDQGMRPMDRYLAEGRSERYTIVDQPDTRYLSTPADCTCFDITQGRFGGNNRVQN